MGKVCLLALVVAVVSVPALAGTNTYRAGDLVNPTPTQNAALKPLAGGIAQRFVLDPTPVPVYDINGNAVIDPATGNQQMAYTWNKYMRWARAGYKVMLQGISLEKIHPFRKAACNFTWPNETVYNPVTGQTVVRQKGSEKNAANPNELLYKLWDGIQTSWPLAYEVDGTQFVLSVIYSTPENVATDQTGGRPGKQHVDVYTWTVVWNTPPELVARISYLSSIEGGTCEIFALPPLVHERIMQYLYGFGSPALGTYSPGVFTLAAAGRLGDAYAALGALESYIDYQGCTMLCGVSGQGSPFAVGAANDGTIPAASIVLNDLYAWATDSGLLLH